METSRCLIQALDAMLEDPDNEAAVDVASDYYTGQAEGTDESSIDLFECRNGDCLVNCRVVNWNDPESGESEQVLTATDGPCVEGTSIPLPKIVRTQFLIEPMID